MRGATSYIMCIYGPIIVSIHAPHARGDQLARLSWTSSLSFNPRPSCEGRRLYHAKSDYFYCFNPRPSCEGRPEWTSWLSSASLFQSTPLMRGATNELASGPLAVLVSIHAPHARGDFHWSGKVKDMTVSIHAPHARGDTPSMLAFHIEG